MHSFLRAVGLSELKTGSDLNRILRRLAGSRPDEFVTREKHGAAYGERLYSLSDRTGLMVRGEYDRSGRFVRDYSLPFVKGMQESLCEYISVEKQSDRDSYLGIAEDSGLGIPLVFYLLNAADYLDRGEAAEGVKLPVRLAGLSTYGKIVLPVSRKAAAGTAKKEKPGRAAREEGGEDHLQGPDNLMLDYFDAYTKVLQRIRNEDILSISKSYFMPCGIASDRYSVMGEILNIEESENVLTGETSYILTIDSNDIILDVCINTADLLGEPLTGRRFRGDIWLISKCD